MLYFLSVATLREKIGQLFMVGLSGEELTGREQSILKQFPAGGFILFSRNYTDPAQWVSLCRSLWATGIETPPFIAIDHEGGRVNRLPKPFTHFPAPRLIGRKSDPALAYSAGRAAATELALGGINLNFAPVLDVDSNPANPIIGDRSFGANPVEVAAIAGNWTNGLRDGRIIPCGKHFPGHGDTDKDSHLDLPVVEKSLAELAALELPPFMEACRNHIESLMTAHVIYRALDRRLPATLSPPVVTELLRQSLGYDGVVFTDDMDMKAISEHYGREDAAQLAIHAGVDVLLYCHELSRAAVVFDFIFQEAQKTPALQARVDQSYRRVVNLKRRHLNKFTGVAQDELVMRLVELDHQRIVDQFQGNL